MLSNRRATHLYGASGYVIESERVNKIKDALEWLGTQDNDRAHFISTVLLRELIIAIDCKKKD